MSGSISYQFGVSVDDTVLVQRSSHFQRFMQISQIEQARGTGSEVEREPLLYARVGRIHVLKKQPHILHLRLHISRHA